MDGHGSGGAFWDDLNRDMRDPQYRAAHERVAEMFMKDNGAPPQATVTQAGRWWYRVDLVDGMLPVYTGYRWGRERAQRLARRKLDRYVRRQGLRARWRGERTVITETDIDPANDGTVH